jgi:hypothetical protein
VCVVVVVALVAVVVVVVVVCFSRFSKPGTLLLPSSPCYSTVVNSHII